MKKKSHTASAAFSDVIPTILDPKLHRKIEALCSAAIQFGGNHPQIRAAIASLNMEMRCDSNKQHGYDTIDCNAIAQLLKRTDPNGPPVHQPPSPDRDPIDVLERLGFLVPAQVSAAEIIRTVWQAFGRCLSISGRGYDRSGGTMRRASALQPMDVMGQETWEIYQEVYLPWFNVVKDLTTPCLVTGNVKIVNVVFRVVLDEYFPANVDKFLQLEDGRTMTVLKIQLDRFFDVHDAKAALTAPPRSRTGPGMVETAPKAVAA